MKIIIKTTSTFIRNAENLLSQLQIGIEADTMVSQLIYVVLFGAVLIQAYPLLDSENSNEISTNDIESLNKNEDSSAENPELSELSSSDDDQSNGDLTAKQKSQEYTKKTNLDKDGQELYL
ncbi:hypothetical protein PV327_010412 [Microctonus hyperodae]|uniref:Uncharacterized protein n=1 Tax=Microctonus hyperodae TaxID=165561 RepID=A0AA39KUS0_MICHY|nr:hypothetical protein PV327_010412 [Microctonus hyperodae]